MKLYLITRISKIAVFPYVNVFGIIRTAAEQIVFEVLLKIKTHMAVDPVNLDPVKT